MTEKIDFGEHSKKICLSSKKHPKLIGFLVFACF